MLPFHPAHPSAATRQKSFATTTPALAAKAFRQAVKNINTEIANALSGKSFADQEELDSTLKKLDGTDDKSNLGANAILAVSIAYARASAKYKGLPLYRTLCDKPEPLLPCPMMNILNGGAMPQTT